MLHNTPSIPGCHASRRPRRWLAILTPLVLAAPALAANAVGSSGPLPRRASFAPEQYPGLTTEYGVIAMPDGARLRSLVTRPAKAAGRLPAIHYLQWLSCDSVELAPTAQDGWTQFLRGVITQSNALVLRVDKSGVGDSLGTACADLDYDTELAHHRAAHAWLRTRPDVDSERIVVLGASMGSTFAPLVAQGQRLRGVAVWGGGARTWLERQMAFDRRALELNGTAPADVAVRLRQQMCFQWQYLVDRQTPAQIAARDPALGAVWSTILGTETGTHYGRPFAFHHQAQAHDWAAAWAQLDSPALALLGDLDWFEEPRSAQRIAEIVNAHRPGTGRFVLFAGLDHHFTRYADAKSAFDERGGKADAAPVLAELLPWLQDRWRSP